MRTTPLASFLMTGCIGVHMSEKGGFWGFDHFATLQYASFTSEMAAPISSLSQRRSEVNEHRFSNHPHSQCTFEMGTPEVCGQCLLETLFVVLNKICKLQKLIFPEGSGLEFPRAEACSEICVALTVLSSTTPPNPIIAYLFNFVGRGEPKRHGGYWSTVSDANSSNMLIRKPGSNCNYFYLSD